MYYERLLFNLLTNEWDEVKCKGFLDDPGLPRWSFKIKNWVSKTKSLT